MRSIVVTLLFGATVVACAKPSAAPSGEPPAWQLDRPASWDARVREGEDPSIRAEDGVRSGHIWEYLPQDTSIVPQFVFGVWVYDSTSWAKLSAEEGPPQGDVLTTAPGWVYVGALPQSNPFAPGSVDSVEFDKRSVTLEQVKAAFRLTPR